MPIRPWTVAEEELLARVYCDVSDGEDRTSHSYWHMVATRFNAELNQGAIYRTLDQCQVKFVSMNRFVKQYNRIYVGMRNEPGNAETEAATMERASATFAQETGDHEGTPMFGTLSEQTNAEIKLLIRK